MPAEPGKLECGFLMIKNGFYSRQLSCTVNCTKRGCCLEQLVNSSYPAVSSCLPVYFDSISNPIHFFMVFWPAEQ